MNTPLNNEMKLNEMKLKKKTSGFEDFIKKRKLIVKDPQVFQISYTPTEVMQRKETFQLYKEISNFINYGVPNHLLLIGLPGTGKTVTINHIKNKLKNLKKNIKVIYINCRDKTANQILNLLVGGGAKSISDGELIKRLLSKLEEDCLLILDEIDKAIRIKNLIYSLSRPNELVENFNKNISLVLISNNLNWNDSLDPAIRSSLQLKTIYFDTYNQIQLKRILKTRVKIGFFDEKVIPNKLIDLISKRTIDYMRGDCRVAINTIFYSAQHAEDSNRSCIIERDISLMFDKAAKDIESNRITRLTNNQLFILWACIKNNDKTLDKIQEEYNKISENVNLKKLKSRSMIFYILDYLDMQGLVGRLTKVLKNGKIPKRETKFEPLVTPEIVEEEIGKRMIRLSKS